MERKFEHAPMWPLDYNNNLMSWYDRFHSLIFFFQSISTQRQELTKQRESREPANTWGVVLARTML